MLGIDDFQDDIKTLEKRISETNEQIMELSGTVLMMQGAVNYINSCIKSLEDKEMEEGYKDAEDND